MAGAAQRRRTAAPNLEEDGGACNEVRLRGRVSGEPEARVLPSGDEVVVLRLVVDRPPGARASHDTLDCSAYAAGIRRRALRWAPGDVVEVTGALRRRFYRGGAGAVSRYEVEISGAARVRSVSKAVVAP